MSNKKLKQIVLILPIIVMAVMAIYIYQFHVEQQNSLSNQEEVESVEDTPSIMQEEVVDELTDENMGEIDNTVSEQDDSSQVVTHEESLVDSPFIEFVELQALNPDVYAWISIPGTVIEYPILQHATDNSYYLNYNIDGSYGYPGCIYTENMNAKDFTSNHTVIYGHNMKNGSMFAGLHDFSDTEFFNNNNQVFIYTPSQTFVYQIFAAYVYDDRHLLYSFDFTNLATYESYLDSVFSIKDASANIDHNIIVTSDDRIITLATCVANASSSRFLVQAVLVEVQ